MKLLRCLACLLGLLPSVARLTAWDYEGHRTVNLLALRTLPPDFPAFVREAGNVDRIAYLSGEPDRWRNVPDGPLRHANGLDHYIDLEDLVEWSFDPVQLPPFRHEFTALLAVRQSARNGGRPPLPEDPDRTKQLPGYLPWAITEGYLRLKSGFAALRVYEELGTPEEIGHCRATLVQAMGVLGHYVGDSTQPLHTTRHFNGWVGANPRSFTTNRNFHSWIDGGFLRATGGLELAPLTPRMEPARRLGQPGPKGDNVFPVVVAHLLQQHGEVGRLYALEQGGQLSAEGRAGAAGRDFLLRQLVVGAQFLGDLWFSAWTNAPGDSYLRKQLLQRQAAGSR